MAVVYRAIQINLQRPVALKILGGEMAEDEEFVGRFFNEARAAASLNHVNIIQAFDTGVTEEGIHFFAMEYIEGKTVLQHLQQNGAMPVHEVLRIAENIADALNYGWQRQRLTHGDIKPENIMINTEDEPKLADFGLAKVAEHDFAGTDVMLTPLYAPPEAIRGELEIGDCRGDIYSFGATMYQMLCGQPPFTGSDPNIVLQHHLEDPPPPPHTVNPKIPKTVSDFVLSLLEKDPAQRPQDWELILRKIKALRKQGVLHVAPKKTFTKRVAPQTRAPSHHPPVRKKKNLFPIFFFLALALTLALFFAFIKKQKKPTPTPTPTPKTETTSAETATEDSQEDVVEKTTPAAPEMAAEARAEWRTLRKRLRVGDMQATDRLALLETFKQKYSEEKLPAAFEKELKKTRDLQQSQLEQPAETATGDSPEDEQEEPAETRKPGTGKAENETQTAVAAKRLEVPLDIQSEDDYFLLMLQISSFPYLPGTNVERIAQEVANWQRKYPGESNEFSKTTLIAEIILPALDECLPKLVANQKELIGKQVQMSPRSKAVIQELTLEYCRVTEKVAAGEMVRKIYWTKLREPHLVLSLCHLLMMKPGTTIADRRSYLGLLLFSHNDQWWNNAAKGLEETPELRLWIQVRNDFETAQKEGEEILLWQKIYKNFENHNDLLAYRLAKQLAGMRSRVAYRHRNELKEILARTMNADPEAIAGKLVLEAQEQQRLAPLKSLSTLNFVTARYGAGKFPEEKSIDELRSNIIAQLSLPEGQRFGGVRALTEHLARIHLYEPPHSSPPQQSMLIYNTLKEREDFFNRRNPTILKWVEGIAWLDLGDWQRANDIFSEIGEEDSSSLPPKLQFCTAFSRGLVANRFGEDKFAADKAMLQANEALKASQTGTHMAKLLCSYALITGINSKEEIDALVQLDAVASLEPDFAKKEFILLAAALYIETAQKEKAINLLTNVSSEGVRGEYSISGEDVAFIKAVLSSLNTKTPLQYDYGSLPNYNREIYLTLALTSIASQVDKQEGQGLEEIWELLQEDAENAGALRGHLLYTTTLVRLQTALLRENAKIADAQTVVAETLKLTCIPLYPYYARLLLIQAGLACLDERENEAETALFRILFSTVANRNEKAVGRLLDKDYPRSKIKDQVRKSSEGKFWFLWIDGCRNLSGGNSSRKTKILSAMYESKRPLSERQLITTLFQYLRTGTSSDEK